MPEQATEFIKKNWQGLLSAVIVPLVMWGTAHFENLGRIKAELEFKTEQNEILDLYLDVSDELAKCLEGSE